MCQSASFSKLYMGSFYGKTLGFKNIFFLENILQYKSFNTFYSSECCWGMSGVDEERSGKTALDPEGQQILATLEKAV